MSSATTETTGAELTADTGSYKCPFCRARYPHETIARVHVLRSDDDNHINHNGLMPDVAIEKTDASGTVVDTIHQKTQVKSNDVDESDLPDRFSTREKRILMVAIYNPYTDTYTDLQDRVNGLLDFHGEDPVSYNKVRETLQGYLEVREKPPQHQSTSMPEATETTTDTTTPDTDSTEDVPSLPEVAYNLEQLKQAQRNILIEWVGQDNPKKTHIAALDHVDKSQSYPGKVIDNYGYIVDDLQTALDAEGITIDSAADLYDTLGLDKNAETNPDAIDYTPVAEPTTDETGEPDDSTADTDETSESSGDPTRDPMETLNNRTRRELGRLSPNHQKVIKAIAAHPGASDEALASELGVGEIVVSQLRRKHSNDDGSGLIDKLESTYGDVWELGPDDQIEADDTAETESDTEAESEPESTDDDDFVQDGPTTGYSAQGMSASPTDLQEFNGTDATWQSSDKATATADDAEATADAEATETETPETTETTEATETPAETPESTESTGSDTSEEAEETAVDAENETPAPDETLKQMGVPMEILSGDGVPVEKVEDLLGAIQLFKRSANIEAQKADSREAARVLGVMEELESMTKEIIEDADDNDDGSPSAVIRSATADTAAD